MANGLAACHASGSGLRGLNLRPSERETARKVGGAIKQRFVDKSRVEHLRQFQTLFESSRGDVGLMPPPDRRIVPVLRTILAVMMQNLSFSCLRRMRENDNNLALIHNFFFFFLSEVSFRQTVV